MPNLLEKIKCDYLGIDEHCQTIESSFDINTENECISVDFNADFDCEIIAGETCDGLRVWGSSQEMTIKHIKMNVVCILDNDDCDVERELSDDEMSEIKELVKEYIYENAELSNPNVYYNANGCY